MKLQVLLATAVVLGVMAVGTYRRVDAGSDQTITVKGSDTMAKLCAAWADAFMKRVSGVRVAVGLDGTEIGAGPWQDFPTWRLRKPSGEGSGLGIADMIKGHTDICAASRKVREVELEQGSKKGVSFKEFIVARDGISVIVNKENPIQALTMDQLHKIFIGSIKNWSEVGGPDGPITVLTRDANSGTCVCFQEEVLEKDKYAKDAKTMPSNDAIAQAVLQDKNAIGYVGLAYAKAADVKIVPLKRVELSQAVMPSDESIMDETYPICRSLRLYTNGEPKGNVKAFVDFALSQDGQKIVQDIGFVPAETTGQMAGASHGHAEGKAADPPAAQ